MSSNATEFQKSSPSLPLPPDHVLNSGAVTFPGAFDLQGCPLVVFPVEEHGTLASLTQEEVIEFINYFLCLQNKHQENESMVSVVVDLRQANRVTARFIAETLLLLEASKRTLHTAYVVQPKKRDVLKLLHKLLVPSHSKYSVSASFKRIFLKEIFELSNYIDRSQLTATLGGYLIYSHQSWATFIKEIDAFVQDFLSVVHRLPACIATLQTLSKQPVPSDFEELQEFCSVNEARFLELRRELGLDDLLRHCEHVLENLRFPENESCYQAMAGTALFTHTAYDMLQNYSRITAAVEKIELLWQQAISRAHLQLKVLHLRKEAQQITEHINNTGKEKLQPYRIEIAKNARRAESLKMEFEKSIYTPAMALVRRAEDVIHTFEETVPPGDTQVKEDWVDDLERLKENFRTSVELPHQTLRAVSDFYYYYNNCKSWYNMVLCQNFLQDLLWSRTRDGLSKQHNPQVAKTSGVPAWKQAVYEFLKKYPPPEMEDLVQLAHLANVIPDGQLQKTGKQVSQRGMLLRKLLTSPGPVLLHDLQLALLWQYEFLKGSRPDLDPPGPVGPTREQIRTGSESGLPSKVPEGDGQPSSGILCGQSEGNCGKDAVPYAVQEPARPPRKPPSLSSFDSGFDCAGSSHLDAAAVRESWEGFPRIQGTRETFRSIARQPQIHEENISSVSDSEDYREEFDYSAVGGGSNSKASIQIIPKVTMGALNFEIKVKRSATMPNNPWLSLPVEDLENSYTVTISPNTRAPQDSVGCPDPCERSRDQPTQTEMRPCPRGCSEAEEELTGAGGMEVGATERAGVLQAQNSFEVSDLSPIRNVLSSTITDARDKQESTVDSVPTLLWDTYDFHNNKQEVYERLGTSLTEGSLTDWHVKEQEGLEKVEEILDRAAVILQEEENVLVQEKILDVLMEAENCSKPWRSWGSEERLSMGTMSSSDLLEAGVVGIEDKPSVTSIDQGSEYTPPEPGICSPDLFTANDRIPDLKSRMLTRESSRYNVLTELKGLHVLEEKILEENLKIQEFRQFAEEERFAEQKSEQTCKKYASEERQKFLRELENEKKEVEKMESSLDTDMAKGSKLKNRLSREPQQEDGDAASLQWAESQRTPPMPKERKSKQSSQPQASVVSPDMSKDRNNNNNTTSVPGQDLCVTPDSSDFESTVGSPTSSTKPVPQNVLRLQGDTDDVLPSEEVAFNTDLALGDRESSQVSPEDCMLESVGPFDPSEMQRTVDAPECPLQTCGASSRSVHRSPLNESRLSINTNAILNFKIPIVLDTGSGLVKAGFADQDLPTAIFPTVIGIPKYEEVMNGDFERDCYIGHEAQHMRGVLALKHPMKNGIVRNWDEMEKIWHHAFQQLRVEPEDHPVLLTEAAMNPRENRQRMMELMFEAFSVPYAYIAMQAVLALYASGRTTGVVFDSGDGVSHSVPVFEGYSLPHAVQRFTLAGELEIVREIKERCCCVAQDYDAELACGGPASREVHYTMPDGQVIRLTTERFRAPEILFKPEQIGLESYGMHESIFKSILQTDIDLRKSFFGNIVLSGGNTLLAGLPQRLQSEIQKMVPANHGEGVRVTSPVDRDFSVWRGGAVLASLPSFGLAWISEEEYEEFGPQIVFRKCF
ncbi:hypothetical protein GJAV_G00119550 [Gymnothorax javanicus]|nr:hypothetical protein GJAV_G00119550 [Gymnothorax javanicus]